jgi:pimeloyl-ACP methyl ester carboxylesterase
MLLRSPTSSGQQRLGGGALGPLLVMLLAAMGCTPAAQLVDERSTAPYKALRLADEQLLERSLRLDASEPGGPTLVVHAREIGLEHEEGPVLVLLNGIFSDGRTWRFVTAQLAAKRRVLVLDLPGTGQSSAPDPESLGPEAYTPRWIARATLRALGSWQAQAPERREIVLVGHSIAGTVAMHLLGSPALAELHDRLDARVAGAVLIAPADILTATWSPTLVELAKLSELEVGFGSAFGILESRVEQAIAGSVEQPDQRALGGEATRILENLQDRSRRRASQAMLQRIRPVRHDDTPIWPEVRALAEDYEQIRSPTLLLWGRLDDALPVSMGEELEGRIPGAKLEIVEGVRHSVHQEAPYATADAIERFASRLQWLGPRPLGTGRMSSVGSSPPKP